MCSNKTVGPDTQTCIKSLNCQTGKHRLTPANRSRTHTGSGAEQAIYKQLPGGNSPPHTVACHPSVNNTGKCCLLSYPILHFWELPKTLEKQFNKKLLYYIKLLESPNLSFPTTDTVQKHREQTARCVKNSLFFSKRRNNFLIREQKQHKKAISPSCFPRKVLQPSHVTAGFV